MNSLERNQVGVFNFTLQTSRGEQLNEQADEAVAYLHGYGNILPGMEQALAGKKAGDSISVTLSPKDAYGEYIDESPLDIIETALENILTPFIKEWLCRCKMIWAHR